MTKPTRPSPSMYRTVSAPLTLLSLAALLGVVGLAVAPAHAQTTVGMKGGLNLSGFHGTDIGEAETRQGHIFGAFLNTSLWGPLSVQPEAYYSRRGATGADIHTEALGDVTNRLWNYNYLDITPLLKLSVSPGVSSTSFSVFGGPVVSFLVGAKATGTKSKARVPPYEGAFPYVSPLNYNTKGTDFGGVVGVDLTFDIGPTQVILDARYTRMMTEFDEAPYDAQFSRKHNALSFQIGVGLTPNAWRGGRRQRRRRAALPTREPPVNTVVLMQRITREDIAARRENESVYDIIRLERPQWVDAGEQTVRGTLFLDGQPWVGADELLQSRRGTEVQEIRRLQGAPGPYKQYAVVIEVISRGL